MLMKSGELLFFCISDTPDLHDKIGHVLSLFYDGLFVFKHHTKYFGTINCYVFFLLNVLVCDLQILATLSPQSKRNTSCFVGTHFQFITCHSLIPE